MRAGGDSCSCLGATKVNGDVWEDAMKVEKAKATWLVDGDREVKISLRGRLIRWVYIFLFLSSLAALSICYLRGKST